MSRYGVVSEPGDRRQCDDQDVGVGHLCHGIRPAKDARFPAIVLYISCDVSSRYCGHRIILLSNMSDSHSTALLMLLVLARLPSLSESVAFRPQPTGLTAQSPVTDAAPKPTLFARDEHTLIGSSQTCGYFDQDADDPYGCSGSSMCAYVSADSYGGGDWGPFCCDPFDASCPTPMATTCLDYSDDDNPVTAELTAFSTLFW